MQASIKAISVYLPKNKLSNDDLSKEFPLWSADKISKKTGIYSRSISEKNETSGDMAVSVSEKLFFEHKLDKSKIDFILLCTQSPDYFLPTTACIVQNKLELQTNCGALDFNLGCSGYIYGLALAKGLITSGIANNVLLITSETYSKYIHKQDKSNRTIFSDAAAASLISKDDYGIIEQFSLGSDGSGADNLIVKNGAAKFPKVIGKNQFDNDDFLKNDSNLYMNGKEIFMFTSGAVPKLINDCLSKNNLLIDQVDLFIFHQANSYMLEYMRRKIQIPKEKFYIHLKNVGNTVSSTIPIALDHAIRNKRIIPGMTVLLVGFGVGYSFGATIIKY
jgi:3-oxoacyl-[acyl-carrier-protein] synthase III